MIKPAKQDVAFWMDYLRANDEQPQALHLAWLGQSGFLMGRNNRIIAIDPYLSDSLTTKYADTERPHVRISERVLPPSHMVRFGLRAVCVTHKHTDHLDAETLKPLLPGSAHLRIVAPESIREVALDRSGITPDRFIGMNDGSTAVVDELSHHGDPRSHDQPERDNAGRYLCLTYVIRLGTWTLYHSGDTVVFDAMVDRLKPFKIDMAILPINGKLHNMNGMEAAHLAKDIGAKLVIPCHYDMFEFNTADPDEQFVPECKRIGQPYRVLKLGERLTLDPKNMAGT